MAKVTSTGSSFQKQQKSSFLQQPPVLDMEALDGQQHCMVCFGHCSGLHTPKPNFLTLTQRFGELLQSFGKSFFCVSHPELILVAFSKGH